MATARDARGELLAFDWLGACRAAAQGLRDVLVEHPTSRERVVETGERGGGGDRTLVIDRQVEDVVFAELERLHADGLRFSAVSEERGVVDFGAEGVRVVIDPIDGSLNAKRGLPNVAISIAVACGPTMADVEFAYVYDLGPGEEWWARRGEGACLNDRLLVDVPPERRDRHGRLELVALESASPQWIARGIEGLERSVNRIRAIGTIAVSMSQVADARVDGMLTLWGCRAVDVAAAQLIVRESGGHVAFPACDTELGAPLDLVPHSPVVAARTRAGLEELAAIVPVEASS
jgi:myo-inositol-1(or 4)-monophosphatase